MVDVFISYSRTDLAAVTRLAKAIEAEGYAVWWDADLPPHLSYGDVITAKIGMAKAAVVVWSQASAASEWVRAEADMARNQKKLIQTALDHVMPPLPFNQIQFAEIGDWHGEPDHPGWRKVKASLAELVGRGVEPAPARPRVANDPAPVAPPPAASKAPLFAGIAIGVVALLAAGWIVLRGPAASENAGSAAETTPSPVAVASPAPSAAQGPGTASPMDAMPAVEPTDGIVFPDSDRRLLTGPEIANLGPATLENARNEIYARKGRRFVRAEVRDYFSQFDWYRPVADDVQLNAIETQNVAMLRQAESRFGQ